MKKSTHSDTLSFLRSGTSRLVPYKPPAQESASIFSVGKPSLYIVLQAQATGKCRNSFFIRFLFYEKEYPLGYSFFSSFRGSPKSGHAFWGKGT